MKKHLVPFLYVLILGLGCKSYEASTYDFPKPVDTTNKPITEQKKMRYEFKEAGVFVDNLFDGARLNNFEAIGADRFRAIISPENTPINNSAYYAFRVWSTTPKNITIELHYTDGKHRYQPKLSKDGENWTILAEDKRSYSSDSTHAFIYLDIDTDTLWVAAQELQTSKHVNQWCEAQTKAGLVRKGVAGKSKLGRTIPILDIYTGNPHKKDLIIILSRQHPPEVTGYFAMQAFIEEILADKTISNAFREKYRLLVFPLMNPDGVDLGHWRHNAGGIDLNRDWAYYHQEETHQVADFIVKTATKNKSKVILGLDFHSTWYDIFYTNKQVSLHLPHFKDYWVESIQNRLENKLRERPSNVGAPVSKGWFITQFGAEGITYEIGDSTPRDLITKKGKISAIEMMKLLLYR